MSRAWWLTALGALAATVGFLVATMPDRPPVSFAADPAPIQRYEVVRDYPHDPTAYTQGLIYRDGFLYESTGPTGSSTLRKVGLETGEVLARRQLDARVFGEGLTEWKGRLFQLTPVRVAVSVSGALGKITDPATAFQELGRKFGVNAGTVYDATSFATLSTFTYDGEGWGLTAAGDRLALSNGTSILRFLDPETFRVVDRVEVRDGMRGVALLNELEWVEGEILANVWYEERIAVIDPGSGRVKRWIDLDGVGSLMSPAPDRASGAVLNGIAYDAAGKRLFVTGKLWPRLFEIRPAPGP